MKSISMTQHRSFIGVLCAVAVLLTIGSVHAAPSARNLRVQMGASEASQNFGPDLRKQDELIAKIQSPSTPKGEKAVSCKHLVIHGTDKALPALVPLLSDPQLASWARTAIEAIPGPQADAALRDAMPSLKGNLLVGVINSIGVRGDARAVKSLSAKLADSDPEVISASAVALGKIGGTGAASALQAALKTAPSQSIADVAEGAVRCAEKFLEQKNPRRARALYDAVREAKVPPNKQLEAVRGAILARGDAGITMLIEEIRSLDQDRFSIGLRTARELPGRKATDAIAAEVRRSPEERQPHVLLALADRHDPAAIPTVVDCARSGSRPLRLVAVGVLERIGTMSSVPVLIEVAQSQDAALSQAAIGALTRLPAEGVEADLVSRLQKANGREREVLIRIANQRQIPDALGAIMASTKDRDPAVRRSAVQAAGNLGSEKQLPELVQLLQGTSEARDKGDIEDAMVAISSRSPAAVASVAPLARSSNPELRSLALRCLSASGGPEALAAVRNAVEDKDPGLQDEAVRALSTWPNTWPEDSAVAEPLLALARSGAKGSHKVLALRGYLQYIEGDPKLQPKDKVTKIREALSLAQRSDEKQRAIAVLSEVFDPAAVDVLVGLSADEAVREDACSALLKLGTRDVSGLPKPDRQKALRAVLERSAVEKTRQRAEDRLKALQ